MTVVSLPSESWVQRVEGLGPVDDVELVAWEMKDAHPRQDEIEVVVPPYMTSVTRLERLADLPRLRAVQLLTAGYDHAVPYLPEGVTLAKGTGIHDSSTAELAVTLALSTLRGIPQFVRAQDEGAWLRLPPQTSLADRRVLIVGYGSIGRAIAGRLQPFEVELTAVASRPRDGDELVDRVHGIGELPGLLGDHDVVILVLPLTETTRGLVDHDFLARMPDGAVLVNVARGPVVDTGALIEACASGRIRAGLDVTEPEPLPEGHPLFSTPGVLISPHVGGASTAMEPRAVRLLRAELDRYVRTGKLGNTVRLVAESDAAEPVGAEPAGAEPAADGGQRVR